MLSEEVPHLQASFDPTVVFGGVTQYIVWMVICWIITLVLILVVGRKLTLIPTNKFVNTVEYGYQFVRNDMGEGIIGHGFKKHGALPRHAVLLHPHLELRGSYPRLQDADGHRQGRHPQRPL